VSYDANGNITKYKRNKDAGVTQDSLNYKYNAGTNQLQYITDNVATNVSTTDIDNQSPNNYIYDKSGNMVADNSQSMSVSWSPYGKILQNNKAGGANLTFGYNAMQQRVLKRVVLAGDTTRTYYIRDAQGNTMGVYTRHNDSVSWREQYIFGSSRLGLYRADTLVNKGLQVISKLYEGKRNYELTNHLGNVMAVINDRKADTTIGVNKGYNAVVISATDYFPFGMAIDSRSYTSSLYRYGFNTQERDNEINGNTYTAEFWEYDARSGRRWNLDPVNYPHLSPYSAFTDNPILFSDTKGDCPDGNCGDREVVLADRLVRKTFDPKKGLDENLLKIRNAVGQYASNGSKSAQKTFVLNSGKVTGGTAVAFNAFQELAESLVKDKQISNFLTNDSKSISSYDDAIKNAPTNQATFLLIGERSQFVQTEYAKVKLFFGETLEYFENTGMYSAAQALSLSGGNQSSSFSIGKSGKGSFLYLRNMYVYEVRGLSSIAEELRSQGQDVESIARRMSLLRRELGVKYKDLTPPDVLQKIYTRNLEKYGDKLGPSVEFLRKQGKSWEDIIRTSTTPGGKDLNFYKN